MISVPVSRTLRTMIRVPFCRTLRNQDQRLGNWDPDSLVLQAAGKRAWKVQGQEGGRTSVRPGAAAAELRQRQLASKPATPLHSQASTTARNLAVLTINRSLPV